MLHVVKEPLQDAQAPETETLHAKPQTQEPPTAQAVTLYQMP